MIAKAIIILLLVFMFTGCVYIEKQSVPAYQYLEPTVYDIDTLGNTDTTCICEQRSCSMVPGIFVGSMLTFFLIALL